MKGKIILIPVPYTDLTAAKLRPAMVIFEGKQDLIVAAITTTMFNASSECDVYIGMEHPEFYQTGLKAFVCPEIDQNINSSQRPGRRRAWRD